MKKSKEIRCLDEFGRLYLPTAIREKAGLSKLDFIEIYADGKNIYLKRHIEPCNISGKRSENNVVLAEGRVVVSLECIEFLMGELEKYVSGK
ncbi:hypothetical protein CON22_24705 [Bacillus cereus]|nr:hypothetical protein CON22_24705 [Bacillus cereus]